MGIAAMPAAWYALSSSIRTTLVLLESAAALCALRKEARLDRVLALARLTCQSPRPACCNMTVSRRRCRGHAHARHRMLGALLRSLP